MVNLADELAHWAVANQAECYHECTCPVHASKQPQVDMSSSPVGP